VIFITSIFIIKNKKNLTLYVIYIYNSLRLLGGIHMKRKEIKDLLVELGASPRLLEMPAVMERIYNYCIDYGEEELKKEINIGPNGEIEYKNNDMLEKYSEGIIRRFKETENGEAIFENFEQNGIEQSGQYFIDKYGMDRMFKDDSNQLFEKGCSVSRTEEGTLVLNGGDKVTDDQGDPILNYNNYTVLRENASRTIGWEGNKDFLIKYYPITREWFTVREKIIEKDQEESVGIGEEENSEVEILRNRIRTIEENYKKEIEKLTVENDKLKGEKTLLQTMLKRTLEVCESVKRSPLGKIFFGRKLKQLPEASGIDER